MKRLFNALADETPPTTGAEIGAALAPALAEIAAAGERQAAALGKMLAQAMADAIKHADQKAQVSGAQTSQILQWEFDVIRDERGLMARVIARAGTVN